MDVENSKINLITIIILIRIIRICWWRKNIITILLRLELLIISLFTVITFYISEISLSSLLIILTIIVRGSRIGLRLLISLSHTHNSSNSSFINIITFAKNYPSYIFYINFNK